MKQSELSTEEVKYSVDFKKQEVKYFPKAKKAFMLVCTVNKTKQLK